MKRRPNFKTSLVLLFVLGLTISACDKNDIDVFGSADVKVINLAPNSGSQKFILANIPEIGNLDYLDGSVGYLNVASGNNLVVQFRDEDDNDLYASGQFDLDDNRDYTIYLTGASREDAEVHSFQDDLNVPAAGKAKIKFLHLSSSAPATVDFSMLQGNTLISGLAKYSASAYSEIDAGSNAITVTSAGGGESIATLPATEFAAGKIYSIYLSGSSTTGYTVRQVLHN